jgi:hypothetical protein
VLANPLALRPGSHLTHAVWLAADVYSPAKRNNTNTDQSFRQVRNGGLGWQVHQQGCGPGEQSLQTATLM